MLHCWLIVGDFSRFMHSSYLTIFSRAWSRRITPKTLRGAEGGEGEGRREGRATLNLAFIVNRRGTGPPRRATKTRSLRKKKQRGEGGKATRVREKEKKLKPFRAQHQRVVS